MVRRTSKYRKERWSALPLTAIDVNAPTFKVGGNPVSLSKPPKKLQEYLNEIQTLSSKGDRGAANEAESLLREMIEKYKDGMIVFKPSGGCYHRCVIFTNDIYRMSPRANCSFLSIHSSVIRGYAAVGLPEQAENILNLMFTDFKNGNNLAEPDVHCFTCKN
jgi:PPR repeat